MDGYNEDLSSSPFFKTLKLKYPRIMQNVERFNGWIVLVPQKASLEGVNISQDIIESHVLQPSPYFTGEYITVNEKSVSIENRNVITGEGFSIPRTANVLFEEVFYTRDKSYQVYCISNPIIGVSKNSGSFLSTPKITPNLPKRATLDASISFLNSPAYPVNSIVISKLETQINEFAATYVMVKGFERDAITKVKNLFLKALEDFLCANPDFRQIYTNSDSSQMNGLSQVIETFVMGQLHQKIFSSLKSLNKESDESINKIISANQHIKLKDLGIDDDLELHTGEGIYLLKQLDSKTTPLDKLYCLQDASDSIANSLSIGTNSSSSPPFPQSVLSPSPPKMITADELLPMLVFMIVKAKVPNLATTLAYIEGFILTDVGTSSLGYHLVNLQASIEFIKSEQFNNGSPLKTGSPDNQSPDITSPSYNNHDSNLNNYLKKSLSTDTLYSSRERSHEPLPRSSTTFFPTSKIPNQTQVQSPVPTVKSAPPARTRPVSTSFSATTTTTTNTAPKPKQSEAQQTQSAAGKYLPPPTVIHIGPTTQDQDLGDFLSELKKMDDETILGSRSRPARR
eukprot:TRINITY_DN2544_c0_g1_i8.p1 TRINITY_DN2544_c0_g1~~TRINITY_DN2544_c0_g1_i8.p1  ORF type:complete len:569 (+),score=106.64 TRINITY_DN2544_c0_g1_i8:142-1848(+)